MRHEVFAGPERRRRWSVEEKLAIVEEVGINGWTVSDVPPEAERCCGQTPASRPSKVAGKCHFMDGRCALPPSLTTDSAC